MALAAIQHHAHCIPQLITHVFRDGDEYLDSDAVFGVRNSLIGDFVSHPDGIAPDGSVLVAELRGRRVTRVASPAGAGACSRLVAERPRRNSGTVTARAAKPQATFFIQ